MDAARHPTEPQWPPVQIVADKELYRTRDADELEKCQWRTEDGTADLAPRTWVRLRSSFSTTRAQLTLANKTSCCVRPIWLDFDGNEVAHSVLEPRSSKMYETFMTHPWICREVESGVRMMLDASVAVVAMERQQAVVIKPPPLLEWNTERHVLFPEECRQRTLALLRSHKHLEKVAAAHAMPLAAVPIDADGLPVASHLGLLPTFLVGRSTNTAAPACIAAIANTTQYSMYQTMYQPPLGRPDITPVLLPHPVAVAIPATAVGPAEHPPPLLLMPPPPNDA